jgi:hypothetical protein
VAGLAVDGPVVAAREVPLTRPLDLDHSGPEIGKLTGGERSGDGLLERDDDDALQRRPRRLADPTCHAVNLAGLIQEYQYRPRPESCSAGMTCRCRHDQPTPA